MDKDNIEQQIKVKEGYEKFKKENPGYSDNFEDWIKSMEEEGGEVDDTN